MKVPNSDLLSKFIDYKKNGLSENEISQLRGSILPNKITTELAQKINTEISKDKKIDKEEQQFLQLIGQSIENKVELKKIESSIDPAHSEISKLIELGFKSRQEFQNIKTKDIALMSTSDKITESLKRSLKYMPEKVREKVSTLFTEENLAIMGTTLGAYALSHAVGVGEVADIVLGAIGVVGLGSEGIKVSKDLYNFTTIAVNAKSGQELENSAKHFAEGISTASVDLTAFLGAKKVMQSASGIKININPPNKFAFATSGVSIPIATFPSISISKLSNTVSNLTASSIFMMGKNNSSKNIPESQAPRVEPKIITPNSSQLRVNGIHRIDKKDTNITRDVTHAHLLENEKIAVDVFGEAHHGKSEGYKLTKKVADYLRSLGFKISEDNIIKPKK